MLVCFAVPNGTLLHVRDLVTHATKSFANGPKENTMNRRATLAMTTTALLCLAVGLSASGPLAQPKSVKEQLVGTWTLVSSDQVLPDGSKLKQFGANPKGINVFAAHGRFFHGRERRQFKNRVQSPEPQDEFRG